MQQCNQFNVLRSARVEEKIDEVNIVEEVQEIVEITTESGAAKGVWPIRKKEVTMTKSTKSTKLAAVNGSPIRVGADTNLEFVRDGRRCNMKFLDADVKKPLASVSAIVDEGSVVVFGPQEANVESASTGQSIPMCRRKSALVAAVVATIAVATSAADALLAAQTSAAWLAWSLSWPFPCDRAVRSATM